MPPALPPDPAPELPAPREVWRRSYVQVHGREPTDVELQALMAAEAALGERPVRQRGPGPLPAYPWSAPPALAEDDVAKAVNEARQHGLASLQEAVHWFVQQRPTVTMESAVPEYLIAKRCQGIREDSMRAYRDILRFFIAQYPELTVAQVTPRHVLDHIMRWANATTRATRWQTLATFFAWAYRRGYCATNPVIAAMRKPARPRPERCIYTPDEAAAILRQTQDTDQFGYWAVALFAGLRTSEIRWLEAHPDPWSLIHAGVIDLRDQPPKSYPRAVPIPPVLEPWLDRMRRRSVSFIPANHWVVRQRVKRSALAPRYNDLPATATPASCRFSNMPRRSCVCYRLALPGASYAQVSEDMGNSEWVLRHHYAQRVSGAEAERYFSLTPDRL